MAYIILSANGEEIDRIALQDELVIGRSPECDVSIRDVLMSRRHLRLERRMGTWRAIDLNSKNGMRLGWDRVRNVRLHDGDLLRAGRTEITFRSGAFVAPQTSAPRRDKLVRPADPFEALAGTVAGFVLEDEPETGDDMSQSPDLSAHRNRDVHWMPEASGTDARVASPRPQTDHWSPPIPQPRYGNARPQPAGTDLCLQLNPELDVLRARHALVARMSDQALFLAIFMTVLSLLSGGMLVATWMMAT